ncbi:D-amino acid oxidase [Thecamonas trahens ATCC 50062]|uniref:D-amino acid oxidase n=1 Tax=Thecamonas trahens ATCC 50062 TaxID=461836 RepID=A0A0L0DRC9_THETB|nr:D-amino acid oxidase [Thecamonas trahens ATCC 50062]KNC54003.1 D-amino acid oxidase [Thecamonas trahens ATCC 50062]|eukprot:XP_013754019.1 D-amino acid oxidase [Thecamonas trahens ATCC 50062]
MGCAFTNHAVRLAAASSSGPLKLVVLERCEVACAASGRAGGFLARNWCSGPAAVLAETSFDMHAAFAADIAASRPPAEADALGYRSLPTFFAASAASPVAARHRGPDADHDAVAWLDRDAVASIECRDDGATTAQITPRPYTRALLDDAIRRANAAPAVDVELIEGAAVTGLLYSAHGLVAGVTWHPASDPSHACELAADDVVLAMGPWTGRADDWLPEDARGLLDIDGQPAFSLVLDPQTHVAAAAVFLDANTVDCEIYPRPDGSVYVCSGNVPTYDLPDSPRQQLEDVVRASSSALAAAPRSSSHACFLPIRTSNDAVPLIGRVIDNQPLYVAAGHSCWGILNSQATGLALAELVLTGKARTLDLRPFAPSR